MAPQTQQQLKHAAEEFIGSLQKSEAALDQVAHRLEEEFARRYKPGQVKQRALGSACASASCAAFERGTMLLGEEHVV